MTVPVLSSTTADALCSVSSASPDFISMPFSAPLPVPTIIATGVARPSAHGQLITSTDIAHDSANSASAPTSSHMPATASAMSMTIGTNTPAILSAVRAIGAFELDASSTSEIIFESAVSVPTCVALIFSRPLLLIVALMTLSPTVFSTGMLSPVIADWSTAAVPSVTMPSQAMLSPARTITMSPFSSSSAGISISCPSRSTTAVFGDRSISAVTASLVLLFERASRYFPRLTSASIITDDSKYRSCIYVWTIPLSPCEMPQLIRKMPNMP